MKILYYNSKLNRKGMILMVKKGMLICSAPTKDNLVKLINEFYCSENYVITEDNKVYNTKLDRFIDNGIIEFKRNRYYYRIIK